MKNTNGLLYLGPETTLRQLDKINYLKIKNINKSPSSSVGQSAGLLILRSRVRAPRRVFLF